LVPIPWSNLAPILYLIIWLWSYFFIIFIISIIIIIIIIIIIVIYFFFIIIIIIIIILIIFFFIIFIISIIIIIMIIIKLWSFRSLKSFIAIMSSYHGVIKGSFFFIFPFLSNSNYFDPYLILLRVPWLNLASTFDLICHRIQPKLLRNFFDLIWPWPLIRSFGFFFGFYLWFNVASFLDPNPLFNLPPIHANFIQSIVYIIILVLFLI
jgi:hypothetical protein